MTVSVRDVSVAAAGNGSDSVNPDPALAPDMQPSSRAIPAVATALAAGVVRATQVYAPQLLAARDVPIERLSLVLTAVGVVSLALSPVGVAVAGYVWGSVADVERRWLRFVGATFAAAVAGFAAAYLLATVVVALGPTPLSSGGFVGRIGFHVLAAAELVGVPLVALAGAAVAQFRSRSADQGAAHAAE